MFCCTVGEVYFVKKYMSSYSGKKRYCSCLTPPNHGKNNRILLPLGTIIIQPARTSASDKSNPHRIINQRMTRQCCTNITFVYKSIRESSTGITNIIGVAHSIIIWSRKFQFFRKRLTFSSVCSCISWHT